METRGHRIAERFRGLSEEEWKESLDKHHREIAKRLYAVCNVVVATEPLFATEVTFKPKEVRCVKEKIEKDLELDDKQYMLEQVRRQKYLMEKEINVIQANKFVQFLSRNWISKMVKFLAQNLVDDYSDPSDLIRRYQVQTKLATILTVAIEEATKDIAPDQTVVVPNEVLRGFQFGNCEPMYAIGVVNSLYADIKKVGGIAFKYPVTNTPNSSEQSRIKAHVGDKEKYNHFIETLPMKFSEGELAVFASLARVSREYFSALATEKPNILNRILISFGKKKKYQDKDIPITSDILDLLSDALEQAVKEQNTLS